MLKKLLVVGLLACTLTFTVSCALAQETTTNDSSTEVTAEELGVSEPGAFSWLGRLWRNVRILLTVDPLIKNELKLKNAGEDLLKMRGLVKKVDDENAQTKIADLNEKYSTLMQQISAKVVELAENNDSPQFKDFMDKYVQQQFRHQEILQKIEEEINEEVGQKIRQRRELHLENFQQVMTKLQNRQEVKNGFMQALDEVKELRQRQINRLQIMEGLEETAGEMQDDIQNIKDEILEIKNQNKELVDEMKQQKVQNKNQVNQ